MAGPGLDTVRIRNGGCCSSCGRAGIEWSHEDLNRASTSSFLSEGVPWLSKRRCRAHPFRRSPALIHREDDAH